MILADSEIRRRINSGEIKIESSLGAEAVDKQIGPASLDFRLGDKFKFYKRDNLTCIDPWHQTPEEHFTTVEASESEPFILHPGQFVLSSTLEHISVPDDLVVRAEGRSSLGRLGLIIHSTAGYVDPGFYGTITLEITNINEVPIALYPGMRVGQFAFHEISGQVERNYVAKGGKYAGQIDPTQSGIHVDKDF